MQNTNTKLFKSQSFGCNLDFDEVKQELLTLFKSPNPFQIYINSKNIKEKFWELLSCLTLRIKDGFKIETWDEKTFIMTIYKQSGYDKVWINLTESYLRDVKNFDLLNYLYFVKILNKDKQFLAKALFKIYKWEDHNEIKKYLLKYNCKINFNQILELYNKYDIWNMSFDINLREDFVEHFIEKIYLQLDENLKVTFLDNFILKIDKNNLDFWDVSKVMSKIISSYVQEDKYKEVSKMVNSEYYKDIKLCVDDLISKYQTIRWTFYIQMNEVISVLNQSDRTIFWQYIKKQMIDIHYPETKKLFYDYSSNIFLDKDWYSRLAWEFKIVESVSPEYEYILSEYKQINDLKEIILELNDNLFSFFLLPIIYYTISEKLSLRKKDLYKIKYLLLFVFSQNYSEYKKIYKFFNQLEVFLNYENNYRVIEKIQVSFSIIFFVLLSLLISYHYLPIWVFVWILILSLVKANEVIFPNIYYRQKWNIWLKFFATLFLCISSYYWFANFDKVKEDTADLTKKVELLWTISSREVIDESIRFIKTSLFDIKNIDKK